MPVPTLASALAPGLDAVAHREVCDEEADGVDSPQPEQGVGEQADRDGGGEVGA
jgi:hypothetical protein